MADRNTSHTPDRKTISAPITPTPTKTPITQTPISQTTRPIQRYQQRNQSFNPYWNNPSGFIQVNQTPASNAVNDNDNDIANIVNDENNIDTSNTVAHADNNNKMTSDDDKTKYAAIDKIYKAGCFIKVNNSTASLLPGI